MKKYKDKGFKQFDQVNALVWKEHIRQVKKWGIQTHTLFEWLTYTTEELGELAQAISRFEYKEKEKNGTVEEIIKEAISVATLCLKIAEMVNGESKTCFGCGQTHNEKWPCPPFRRPYTKQEVEKYHKKYGEL